MGVAAAIILVVISHFVLQHDEVRTSPPALGLDRVQASDIFSLAKSAQARLMDDGTLTDAEGDALSSLQAIMQIAREGMVEKPAAP